MIKKTEEYNSKSERPLSYGFVHPKAGILLETPELFLRFRAQFRAEFTKNNIDNKE